LPSQSPGTPALRTIGDPQAAKQATLGGRLVKRVGVIT